MFSHEIYFELVKEDKEENMDEIVIERDYTTDGIGNSDLNSENVNMDQYYDETTVTDIDKEDAEENVLKQAFMSPVGETEDEEGNSAIVLTEDFQRKLR